jgi:hypothetical protein
MSTSDIVTRMLEIDGFGWQCGEPLKDKGSYFRCSCGCSQPDKDWDGSMTIKQPMILRDAADEIIRLRAERDEARRMYCGRVSRDVPLDAFDIAKNHGWDCFPQEDGK